MSPVRVVAPTRVKRGRSRRIDRAGTLAEHDVELEVFHRRIQHLFDGARQAMDLVDEQHVAFVEVGEHGGEVAGAFDGRPGRDVQAHTELGGDDVRQRGLAQPRRTGEQEVIGRLASTGGGLEDDREVLADLRLAVELREAARSEPELFDDGVFLDRLGAEQLFAHRYRLA